MPVIVLFNSVFCHADTIARVTAQKTGYTLIQDDLVIAEASRLSNIPEKKLQRAFCSGISVFNAFTFEKERSVSYLKLALAHLIRNHKNCIVQGFASILACQANTTTLKICITAGDHHQTELAIKESGLTQDSAARIIEQDNADTSDWVQKILGINSPWDPSIYDLVLIMDRLSPEKAFDNILQFLTQNSATNWPNENQQLDDYFLAAQIETRLADAGHNVHVDVIEGEADLTINKKVLMADRLENEFNDIVRQIPGVRSVKTRIKPLADASNSYRRINRHLPSKVLLVDDEEEFVQTLSERLQMREIGSAVAYNGQNALDLIKDDEPEVMIIDLKMPGIDGVEILKQVKSSQPKIEIIVLTGHGSEQDRQLCMSLGAFAYLQKPVDITQLTDTLKNAYRKVKQM